MRQGERQSRVEGAAWGVGRRGRPRHALAPCPAPVIPPRPAPGAGFTLLEVVMVLAISAIVLAVGLIRITRTSILMSEGERVARQIVADLRRAQSEAILTGENHCVSFTEDVTKYTDYTLCRVEAGGDAAIEPTRVLPDTVAVTGSASRAEFTPGGDAIAACAYTVTAPPGHVYQITVVLATGAVTLEEP